MWSVKRSVRNDTAVFKRRTQCKFGRQNVAVDVCLHDLLLYVYFLNITSSLGTVAMTKIIDLQSTFHSQYVGVAMIYIRTTFHVPNCSDSLVITIQLKSYHLFYMSSKSFSHFKVKIPQRLLHVFKNLLLIHNYRTLNKKGIMLFQT